MNTALHPPRWQALACGILLGLFAAAPAQATHDNNAFQLEGNAVDDGLGDDWENIAHNGGLSSAHVFIRDVVDKSIDDVFVQGGSKDERDISAAGITGQYWRHGIGNTPDKDNIVQAFAAAYNVDGDLIIYFGANRLANDGDAAIGFWFFKNDVTENANGTFNGTHAVGDILVTSDFRKGGSASVINVFMWNGNASNPLTLLASSSSNGGFTQDGVYCLNGNLACATANSQPETVPASMKPYYFKGSGGPTEVDEFPTGTLFEGGINFTQLLGGQACFSSFLAMTRTSASTSAQLKDFALGDFNLCGMEVAKTCAGIPEVNEDGVSIDTVFDVTVSNTGFGALHNVTLAETIELNETTECRIKAIDGDPADILLFTNQPVEVASLLPGGEDVHVTIACNSEVNGLNNHVIARAKSSPGLAQPDVTADTFVDEVCSATVNPDLSIGKACANEVTLVGGTNQPLVCVDISLTNEGFEKLVDLRVWNTTVDGEVDLVLNGELLPGATLDINNVCYQPSKPDGNETNPGLAQYTDTVRASARGAISGVALDPIPFASRSCPLCPLD